MSQKTTRRARRQTEDDPASFKAPADPDETPLVPVHEEAAADEEAVEEDVGGVVTRSRSQTPLVKLTNGHQTEETTENREEAETDRNEELETERKEEAETERKEEAETERNEEAETEKNEEQKDAETEMDPLIVSDEPDPELVFEENSDAESGRVSPALSRCKTRRSLNRNIPTPKTPKGDVTPTEENDPKSNEDLNGTFESLVDDASTKAQAGGDSTRLEYIDKDVSSLESNSFLQNAKNKSFGETLRHLSTRRTIRPINDDYRKRIFQSNLEKNDLSYPSRHSVDRISSVGLKRKSSNDRDEGFKKRFKSDSPGFFAKFVSPLAGIRNPFRSDVHSSTPKLTGYKDEKFLLEDDVINSQMCEVNDEQRRWCSIM